MKHVGYKVRNSSLSRHVLVLGWVAYLLFCIPLLTSGGYNPGPFWDTMPVLWPAPLIISRLLDPPVAGRRYRVVGYCLGCSLVAAALPDMTPSFFSLSQMMLASIIFAPLYVMTGILIEMLTSAGMRVLRIPATSQPRHASQALNQYPVDVQPQSMVSAENENETGKFASLDGSAQLRPKVVSRRQLAAAIIVLALAIAMLFTNYAAVVLDLPAEARAAADQVWLSRGVRDFHAFAGAGRPWGTTSLPDRIHFTQWLEPHTGANFSMFPTPYWPWKIPSMVKYRAAFYAELARLMKIHGIPAWSLKKALLRRHEVIQLLHSDGFTAIRHFPYAVNNHIVIKDRRSVVGRQTPFPNDVRFPPTSSSLNISFKMLRRHHGDIAVRSGRSSVAVYSSGGSILYEISAGTRVDRGRD